MFPICLNLNNNYLITYSFLVTSVFGQGGGWGGLLVGAAGQAGRHNLIDLKSGDSVLSDRISGATFPEIDDCDPNYDFRSCCTDCGTGTFSLGGATICTPCGLGTSLQSDIV